MNRRDLLKHGLAAPVVLLPGMACADGGGALDLKIKMRLVYSDEEAKEDVQVTRFFVYYDKKFFVANLARFDLSDDAEANGSLTATQALRGASKIGRIHAYYEDGIKGSFSSGLYVAPKTIPKVRSAPVLIQSFYEGKPYTLIGSIKFRPLGTRKSMKLPQLPVFGKKQVVANLYQNQNTLILSPKNIRLGIRMSF